MKVTVAPIDDSQLYIEETENVINILSEPQDKRKKVKYIRKILKFIVTVMTLAAAAIISIRTFYSSTPTTVDSTSAAMITKNLNITTTTTKNWNITTTTTAVTTSVSVCDFEEIDVQSSNYIQHINIYDAKTCRGLCLKHEYCEFFVWVTPDFSHFSSDECWLKWGHISDEHIKPNVASNYRLCKPPVCKFRQIDVDSENYFGHINIPDAETCHSLCLQHEYCEFFVWISPEFIQSNECLLKWGSLTDPYLKADVYANYRSC